MGCLRGTVFLVCALGLGCAEVGDADAVGQGFTAPGGSGGGLAPEDTGLTGEAEAGEGTPGATPTPGSDASTSPEPEDGDTTPPGMEDDAADASVTPEPGGDTTPPGSDEDAAVGPEPSDAGNDTPEPPSAAGAADTCPGELLEFTDGSATTTGDTTNYTDAVNACDAFGNSKDAILRFVAPRDGTATIRASTPGRDSILYVGASCGAANLACQEQPGADEVVSVQTTQGAEYYVVIDPYIADQVGPYTITVSY